MCIHVVEAYAIYYITDEINIANSTPKRIILATQLGCPSITLKRNSNSSEIVSA